MRRRSAPAIHRSGEDLRRTRLARAARSGKKIGVRHLIRLYRFLQGFRNMPLPDDIFKYLRTPFTIQSHIRHLESLLHIPKKAANRCFTICVKVLVYDSLTGYLVAHGTVYLSLLPLGPDEVHRVSLHKPRQATTHQHFYSISYIIIA